MSGKIANVHKFKMQTIGLCFNNHSEGYVEFLGHPSVQDFVNWTKGRKEKIDSVTIDGVNIAVSQIAGTDLLTTFVKRIQWKQDNAEGIKFNLTVSS